VTFFPVPDGNGPYTWDFFSCIQQQDANLPGGETPDAPYRWNDCIVAGMAHRVARIYKPELEAIRKTDAKESWDSTAAQDTENVPLSLAPNLSSYYRR
jgi:hypothetical protein